MTERMQKFLELASGPMGAAVRNFDDYLEARKRGWVQTWGTPQNSTTVRYKITDAGIAALATEGQS